MTSIVIRFLDTFKPEDRKKIIFEFDDAERKDWSNLPVRNYPRKGVNLAEMTNPSRLLAHELMRASLSSQGRRRRSPQCSPAPHRRFVRLGTHLVSHGQRHRPHESVSQVDPAAGVAHHSFVK
ncbi:MAG: DUF3500 domain-containing protein [Bryobacterales bacterium]|nr:DUF3500 domain-containing protein [Bryobacterales bacterium]